MNDFVKMIFSEMKSGLVLAALVVVIAVAVIAALYIIRKKRGVSGRLLSSRTLAALFLAAAAAVILYATLARSSGYGGRGNLHLLRAWYEAWNNYSLKNWLNLLLNVAMFVPVGFLLPIIHRVFEKWYIMFGAALDSTLTIELTQLATGRGMFDVDDIAANALGTMIGYCLIMIFRRARGRKKSWIFYSALPTSAALILIVTVIVYNVKPYGNLEIAPNYTINTSGIEWQVDVIPSDAAIRGAVYKSDTYDKSSCDIFAKEFFAGIGVTDYDTSYYDDETWYMNHAAGDSLKVNHRDRSYEYSYISRDEPSLLGEDRETVLTCLSEMGVSVPESAEYSYDAEGGWHRFEVNMWSEGANVADGSLQCRITEGGKIVKLNNNLCRYEFAAEEELITEREALERLQRGQFNGEYLERRKPLTVQIRSITLSDRIDSKGFLQPVYVLEIGINGVTNPMRIEIPALR